MGWVCAGPGAAKSFTDAAEANGAQVRKVEPAVATASAPDPALSDPRDPVVAGTPTEAAAHADSSALPLGERVCAA